MICDLVDFGDWKRGIRTEGFTTSASSFGNNLGTGLGSFVLGLALTMGGYNPLATVQSSETITAIIIVMLGLPLVLALVCLACVLFWDLDKSRPEVEAFIKSKNYQVKEVGAL